MEARHSATVCIREAGDTIEILLIRTSDAKRWTFPKGRIDPGETASEAAARETIEESGWSGPVAATPLTVYQYRKQRRGLVPVIAFVMQARSYRPGHEPRQQAFFKPDAAREALAQGRTEVDAAELARVVGLASVDQLAVAGDVDLFAGQDLDEEGA